MFTCEQVRVVQPSTILRLQLGRVGLELRVVQVQPARSAVILQQQTELAVVVPPHWGEEDPLPDRAEDNNNKQKGEKEKVGDKTAAGLWQSLAHLFHKPVEEDGTKDRFRSEFLSEDWRTRLLAANSPAPATPCSALLSCPAPHPTPPAFLAELVSVRAGGGADRTVVRVQLVGKEVAGPGRLLLHPALLAWRGIPPGSPVFLQSLAWSPALAACLTRQLRLAGPGAPQQPAGLEAALAAGPAVFTPGCPVEPDWRVLPGLTTTSFQWTAPGARVVAEWGEAATVSAPPQPAPGVLQPGLKLQPDLHADLLIECGRYLSGGARGRGRPAHLLLSGPPGAGKTSLARALCSRLVAPSLLLSCAGLRGKRVEAVRAAVEERLAGLRGCGRPSILVLDDLDVLVGGGEGEEAGAGLAGWLASLLSTPGPGPAILATATAHLHSLLRPARGSLPFRKQVRYVNWILHYCTAKVDLKMMHFRLNWATEHVNSLLLFSMQVELPLLGQDQTAALLAFYLGEAVLEVPGPVLARAEGAQPGDLRRLAERVLARPGPPGPAALQTEAEDWQPLARLGQANLAPPHKNMDQV